MDFARFYQDEWVPHMYDSGKLHGQIRLVIGALSVLFTANLTLIGLVIGQMAL